MPVYKDDLLILQDENYAATKAICEGIGTPMIVSGCVATFLGGSNVSITAGIMFIDNELIKFNCCSGACPVYFKQGTATTSTKVYFDSSVQTVYSERTVEAVSSPPVAQHIIFNFDNTDNRLLNVIKSDIYSQWATLTISGASGLVTFQGGAGTHTATNIVYKKLGKTVMMNITSSFSVAGATVSAIGIDTSALWTPHIGVPTLNIFFPSKDNVAGVYKETLMQVSTPGIYFLPHTSAPYFDVTTHVISAQATFNLPN
mgnify:CR=1 FL=1